MVNEFQEELQINLEITRKIPETISGINPGDINSCVIRNFWKLKKNPLVHKYFKTKML